eukprot:699040-Ditylum_brightwellii.AAC.1
MVHKTWVLDSGANDHMCNNKEYFTTLQQSTIGFVPFGDGKTWVPVKGIGTVELQIASKGTCTSLDALDILAMIIP